MAGERDIDRPAPERAATARAATPRAGAVRGAFAAATLALAAGTVGAAEFRAVAAPAAVLYDAPSRQASRLFVAPRGMPLEVISTLGQWVKVRDMTGDVAWIDRTEVGERRAVIAATLATVRQQPQDAAPPVLQAERGVLLELLGVPGSAPAASAPAGAIPVPAGWAWVRHRDGGSGYVRASEVWGL